MTQPTEGEMTAEDRAKQILAPLFNPEPHPLRKDWSDGHSMKGGDLVSLLAAALSAAEERGREAERADWMETVATYGDYLKQAKEDGMLDKVIEANAFPYPASVVSDADVAKAQEIVSAIRARSTKQEGNAE